MGESNQPRVLLIRSGPTQWEQTGRVCGCTDLPLDTGAEEAIRSELAGVRGCRLWLVASGPDEASRKTAELVAGEARCKVRALDDLREMSLGLWEGMLLSDLEEKFPTAYRQWSEDPSSVAAPGGESINEAQERLVSAIQGLLMRAKPGQAVGVVLRPVAMALIRCWQAGDTTEGIWRKHADGESLRWASFSMAGADRSRS